MQYVDTSVLVAYLTPEVYSSQAIRTFCDTKRHPLAISLWTETEFFSALGIKYRTKQLTEAQALSVQKQYESLKDQFIWLPIIDRDYRTASDFLKHWQSGLRAGYALHLAVATNHNSLLLSLDERLVKAAKQLGIDAEGLRESK